MEDIRLDAREIYPGCFSDEIRLSLSFYDKMRAKTPIELLAKTLNAKLGGDNRQHISARRDSAKTKIMDDLELLSRHAWLLTEWRNAIRSNGDW